MEPYILDEDNQIFGGWFNDWRRVRVNKLEEVLGTDWNGKDVLELGAGFGNIGLYFKEKGAEVVFADANDKCREIIISKDSEASVYEINNDFISCPPQGMVQFLFEKHISDCESQS